MRILIIGGCLSLSMAMALAHKDIPAHVSDVDFKSLSDESSDTDWFLRRALNELNELHVLFDQAYEREIARLSNTDLHHRRPPSMPEGESLLPWGFRPH